MARQQVVSIVHVGHDHGDPAASDRVKWALSNCGVGWAARCNSPKEHKPVTQIIEVCVWGVVRNIAADCTGHEIK